MTILRSIIVVALFATAINRTSAQGQEIRVTLLGTGCPPPVMNRFGPSGADFGATSAEEYAEMASKFLQDALAKGYPTKLDSNGVIRIYDPATNSFGD